MIFFQSKQQQNEKQQKLFEYLYKSPAKRFAWFPRPLQDGRWVWLQDYYRTYGIVYHEATHEFSRSAEMEYNFIIEDIKEKL